MYSLLTFNKIEHFKVSCLSFYWCQWIPKVQSKQFRVRLTVLMIFSVQEQLEYHAL